MRFPSLLMLILLVPLAEIAGFVVAGKLIGFWGTMGLALLSLIVGLSILRREGFSLLRQLRSQARLEEVRSQQLVAPAVRALAAILLIVPGFLSDILAILLFVPAFRSWVWRKIGVKFVVSTAASSRRPSGGTGPATIDLDEDDYRRDADPRSPWLRRPD